MQRQELFVLVGYVIEEQLYYCRCIVGVVGGGDEMVGMQEYLVYVFFFELGIEFVFMVLDYCVGVGQWYVVCIVV